MPKLPTDKLLKMQEAAKERHLRAAESDARLVFVEEIKLPLVKKIMIKKKKVITLANITFWEVEKKPLPEPKIDFTKLPQFQKKKPEPAPEKKIIKWVKELPVEPDEKKVIVRPPTVYSNTSPYGIADELLRGK